MATIIETARWRCPMPSLDFDGDYGRSYRKSIQDSIPGHDVLHEIARAAIRSTSSDAQQVLVVAPAPAMNFQSCSTPAEMLR